MELLHKLYEHHATTFQSRFLEEELSFMRGLVKDIAYYRLGNHNLEEHLPDRLQFKYALLFPSEKVFLEIYLKNS